MSCKFLVQDPVLDFSYSLPSLLRSAMCKCVSVANVYMYASQKVKEPLIVTMKGASINS